VAKTIVYDNRRLAVSTIDPKRMHTHMKPLSTSTYPSQTESEVTIVSERELERLEAVQRYAILDTPAEGAFDRITRLAAQLFDVPIAIVSVIDHDRIWFKSAHGLTGIPEIPREPGLCSTAIEANEPYVLPDASLDERSKNNSLVSGPFGLRFYVGVPLHTNDGHNLGTLCVIDSVAHDVDDVKVEMLGTLAKVIVDELELRLAARRLAHNEAEANDAAMQKQAAEREATTDATTSLLNRFALDGALDDYFAAFLRGTTSDGSLAVVDLVNVDEINRRRGRDAGDRYLRAFAAALACHFAEHRVFRAAGTNFVVLSRRQIAAEDVRTGLRAVLGSIADVFPEALANFGLTHFSEVNGSPRVALRLADSRMYAQQISTRA
jgi:GAF domain-containing protein